MFFKRRLGTRRKTRPGFEGKSHISGISTWKISTRYYHKLSRGHQHFSDTTLRELCIQASWQTEIPKNAKKMVDRSEKKRLPTLAYFAYSDRRSLWRSRMMLGVILSEPRNMKKRPSRMFRLRITKPWPILISIGLLSPQSEKQIMKKIIFPSADICKLAAWGFKSRCTQLWCYLQLFKG